MADAKISALSELALADVDKAADYLVIVDTSAGTDKKILSGNVFGIGTARQVPMVNAGATALAYTNPITITAKQASTSGSTIDFTGIPAGVRRITIMLVGVSTTGTGVMFVQLGDAGGPETSGYSCAAINVASAGATVASNETTAFLLDAGGVDTVIRHGSAVLNLVDASTFTWTFSSVYGREDSAVVSTGGGSKSLSATLTQVRVGTTDAFDAGAIAISYR